VGELLTVDGEVYHSLKSTFHSLPNARCASQDIEQVLKVDSLVLRVVQRNRNRRLRCD